MADTMSERRFRFLDEFDRYGAFLSLYNSIDPEDQETLSSMYRSQDPLVPLILLRFLAEIPEKKAVLPIITIIEEGNTVVSHAAMTAYQDNHYPAKPKFLKPLILSQNTTACRFAVRTLSRAGFVDAYPLILRQIPARTDPVLSEMITALRFLPDPRSVPTLTLLTRSNSEPLRFLSLQTLASLQLRKSMLPASFFLDMSRDDSIRVRRVALEALQRSSTPAISGILIQKVLDRKEDESIRERAIRALAAVPSTDLVAPLIAVLASDDSSSLKLLAEITLKGLPRRIAKGGLIRQLDSASRGHRRWAAVLLAQFLGDEPDVRRILVDLWKSADDETAVELTEMLRELEGSEAERLLLDAMEKSPLVAYAAAGALARILGAGAGPQILAMLKDPRTSIQAKQALLGHWAKRAPDDGVRADLLPWLLGSLHDEVLNMRYLALQVLAWYPLAQTLPHLLDLLAREISPDVVRTVHRQLSQGLGSDPRPLIEGLARHPECRRIIHHAVKILTGRAWDVNVSLPVLERLNAKPIDLLAQSPESFFAVCAHMIEHKGILFQTVWTLLDVDALRIRFLEVLLSFMRNTRRRFPPLPLNYLEAQIKGEGPEFRELHYRLLEADGSPAAAQSLAAALIREENEACQRTGAAALDRLVTGGRR